MRRIVLSLLAIAAITARAEGQSFEVATIKPTPSENAGPVEPSIVQFLPNGFRRTNSTLRTLVRTAYDVQEYQVIGGPGWADTLRFDVEARFDGTFARDQVLRMLQSLLGERFALNVRRETREGDIFALTVANGGPKLSGGIDFGVGANRQLHGGTQNIAAGAVFGQHRWAAGGGSNGARQHFRDGIDVYWRRA